MLEETELGAFESIELRSVFPDEAQYFTPWLLKNLSHLQETLNMDLEPEGREIQVGAFKADIVCQNTADGSWVVIENQLEETDHAHLGKVLTYAAGLDARTVIWIAKRFKDEHRAALDWQNKIAEDDIHFFGIEVELWRIGDSLPAPRFNIVCQPNDWSREVTDTATQHLTESQLQYQKYWTHLRDALERAESAVLFSTPSKYSYQSFGIGHSDFQIRAWQSRKNKQIYIQLMMLEEDAKAHFHLLKEQQQDIEAEFGESLKWLEMPNNKGSSVYLYQENVDPTDEADWQNQHEWMISKLERFYKVFQQRIKHLDADEEDIEELDGLA